MSSLISSIEERILKETRRLRDYLFDCREGENVSAWSSE
jgi:hypothetical protein